MHAGCRGLGFPGSWPEQPARTAEGLEAGELEWPERLGPGRIVPVNGALFPRYRGSGQASTPVGQDYADAALLAEQAGQSLRFVPEGAQAIVFRTGDQSLTESEIERRLKSTVHTRLLRYLAARPLPDSSGTETVFELERTWFAVYTPNTVSILDQAIAQTLLRALAEAQGQPLPEVLSIDTSDVVAGLLAAESSATAVQAGNGPTLVPIPPPPGAYAPAFAAEPPKGIVVVMPGLFASPQFFIRPLIQALLERDLVVIRMLALPSPTMRPAVVTLPHPAPGSTDDQRDRAIAEAVGARFGEDVNQRLAAIAYAVEAALDDQRSRPHMAHLPVGIVGMSGSSLGLPAVWARSPDRFDAAVLIAGGSNVLRTKLESNYGRILDVFSARLIDPGFVGAAGLGLDLPDTGAGSEMLDETELRRLDHRGPHLSGAYLDAAALDPWNLAPRIRGSGLPLLMIHGSADRAVPAPGGDALWERLGRPERWAYPVGHELLFALLTTRTDRIADWMADRLAQAAADPAQRSDAPPTTPDSESSSSSSGAPATARHPARQSPGTG